MTDTTAAIYARVSTSEQVEGTSLADQARKGAAAIEAKGWTLGPEFTDAGVSGAVDLADRPAGADLFAAIARGEVSAVVAWDMSRLGRNARAVLEVYDRLEGLGVSVVIVKEGVDTSTASGRFFRTMLAAVSELERDTIQERTENGRTATAEAGVWPGSRPPLGYMTDPAGRIVEDPEHAPTVRRIFEARAAGHPFSDIAEALNRDGLATRPKRVEGVEQKSPFTIGTLSHIVRQAAYMGGLDALSVTVGGRAYSFGAPALVTVDTWKQAQGQRQGRKTNAARGGRRTATYALGEGRVSHDHGTEGLPTMFGQWRTTKGGKLRLYRCMASRTVEGVAPDCPGLGKTHNPNQRATAVPADVIEATVGLWALDLIADPKAFEAYALAADRALLGEAGADPDDIAAQRDRLGKLASKRERYADMYAEGLIAREALTDRLARLDAEAGALADAIERAEEVAGYRANLALTLDALLSAEIVDNGERDPNADAPENTAQAFDALGKACRRTLSTRTEDGRPAKLSEWAIAEVARLADILGAEVIISEGPDSDPERPTVRVAFSPGAVLQLDTVNRRSAP